MYLNSYQLPIKKETLILSILFIFSFLLRIPIILFYGDTSLENEWGVIFNNLVEHGKFEFHYHSENLSESYPSIFMPPFYVYYLYFFSIFNLNEQNFLTLILSSQILLSSISVILFYEISKTFFSQKLSFYSSILFSIFPLHLYACSQISSISLQIFFSLLFFYFFLKLTKKKNFTLIICFSFVAGLLLLLRGEFIAIFIFSVIYLLFFFNTSIKNILIIVLITLLTVTPYLIRNIITFDEVTITKSFGYNLWKGNNPNSTVEGSEKIDEDFKKEINAIKKNKYYGINFDKLFLDKAINNIKEDPKKYLILLFKKFISFLFIDINSTYPNYYNPLHYIPVLLLGITSLLGMIISNKKSSKLNYFLIVFFINIIIFSIFFILPRYKLAIIPIQIIFTNVLFEYIKNSFFKKND